MLDRMQAQYAAFIGTVTQGDLPTEGMASLYVEMAPGNEVFRVVDIAVKATEAKPGTYRPAASIIKAFFNVTGFTYAGELIAAGLDEIGDSARRQDLVEQAYTSGRAFVTGHSSDGMIS